MSRELQHVRDARAPAPAGTAAGSDAGTADGIRSVEGPAYPAGLKVFSTLLVLATAVAGWRVRDALADLLQTPSAWLIGAAAVVVLVGWVDMLSSRTVIGPDRLLRRGLFGRTVQFEDISHVKLVLVPGLPWLTVPRLVVRTRGLGAASFRAGDEHVLAAMRRLVRDGTRPPAPDTTPGA